MQRIREIANELTAKTENWSEEEVNSVCSTKSELTKTRVKEIFTPSFSSRHIERNFKNKLIPIAYSLEMPERITIP